jgi:DNA polymerase-1
MKLVFDIEANGLAHLTLDKKKNPLPPATKVWCVCAIDVDTGERYAFGPDRLEDAARLLSQASVLIGHNITLFDIPLFKRFFSGIKSKPFDTLIVSRVMFGPPQRKGFPLKTADGFPSHSLEAWGHKLGFPKTSHDQWAVYTPEMLEYCKNDVELSLRIYRKQLEMLKARPHLKRALRIEHDCHPICAEMTENGFPFDLVGARALRESFEIRKAEITDLLQHEFPPIITERYSTKTGKRLKDDIEVFNPGSALMVASRLKVKYGWKCPLTEKGFPNVDGEVLKSLKFPEAKLLMEYDLLTKKLGYLYDWIVRAENSHDGRIHASFDPLRAATSRMSSSQPNLQQIDKDKRMRALFIAPTGMVLVGVDAAGLEGRLAAAETSKFDSGVFQEKLLHGDMHTETLEMFRDMGCRDRDNAKTLFYGALLYGAGDEKTGSIVERDKDTGREIKAKYAKLNPVISKINEVAQYELTKNKSVELCDGRLVTPPYEMNKWTKRWVIPIRKALNYRLQGNGAVVMKVALILSYNRLCEKYDRSLWQMLGIIHDEIQTATDPSIAQDVALLIAQSIEDAGKELSLLCPMAGECRKKDGRWTIGKNWSETH